MPGKDGFACGTKRCVFRSDAGDVGCRSGTSGS